MFLLVHSGSGSVITKEQSFPLNGGTLYFIGREKYHYTFPSNTESYVRSKLFLSSEKTRALIEMLESAEISENFNDEKIKIGALDAHGLQIAERVFDRLNQLSHSSEYYQAEFYSAVLQLIALLGESEEPAVYKATGAIQRAIDFINDNITDDINIDRICEAVYMSKYHFCRLFKKKTGMTVMEYILKTRIMMAKEMLRLSNLSITAISEACAFSSVCYFSRVFKSETGVSPLQYKKAAQPI